MAEMLQKQHSSEDKKSYVCIPIHGPSVSLQNLLFLMEPCKQDPTEPFPQIIHFNVSKSVRIILAVVTLI